MKKYLERVLKDWRNWQDRKKCWKLSYYPFCSVVLHVFTLDRLLISQNVVRAIFIFLSCDDGDGGDVRRIRNVLNGLEHALMFDSFGFLILN